MALHDAYLSVAEALRHVGYFHNTHVRIEWIDSEELTVETVEKRFFDSSCLQRRRTLFSAEKGYSVPKSTPIGKGCEDDPTMMYPNEKYMMYFPDAQLPEEKNRHPIEVHVLGLELIWYCKRLLQSINWKIC